MAKTIYWYEHWSTKKSKKWFSVNAVFGRTMKNVRKHRDITLVTTEWRRNYSVSEPNYYTKFFTENLLAIKMKKKNRDTYEKICPFNTFNTRSK